MAVRRYKPSLCCLGAADEPLRGTLAILVVKNVAGSSSHRTGSFWYPYEMLLATVTLVYAKELVVFVCCKVSGVAVEL